MTLRLAFGAGFWFSLFMAFGVEDSLFILELSIVSVFDKVSQ